MIKLTEATRNTIQLARKKAIDNSWQLLQTAVGLFEREQYSTSCFLGMTTIEEVGKLPVLQLMQGDVFRVLGVPSEQLPLLDPRQLDKFIRSHLEKALQAAARSLYINAGADQRHGVHPTSRLHRTSGVVLLARSGQWMNIRNACLYTDIDLTSASTTSPADRITREHAYYFISMAFEVLAEQASSGFGNSFESADPETMKFWQDCLADLERLVDGKSGTIPNQPPLEQRLLTYSSSVDTREMDTSMRFRNDRIDDLERFMKRWSSTVCLDRLDFLANPEPLRRLADDRENKVANPGKGALGSTSGDSTQ